MAKSIEITVKETSEELKKVKKSQPLHKQIRVQMLLLYKSGKTTTKELIDSLGVNKNSIFGWKSQYKSGGLELLLSDGRGINNEGQIKGAMRPLIEKRLGSAAGGFKSYNEAQQWINATFGLEVGYQAVRHHLREHYGTKLKVARKSHINKDTAEEAVFKKPSREFQTY